MPKQKASNALVVGSAQGPIRMHRPQLLDVIRSARVRHNARALRACKKTVATLVLSCFPVFVPSLSWQNDHF